MILLENNRYRAERKGRHLVVSLLEPHLVLSTCPSNGGISSTMSSLVNHQSCEGKAHDHCSQTHQETCDQAGTSPESTVVLGTAANMQQLATASARAEGQEAVCIATAGVGSNATRAGDPASWIETAGSYRAVGLGNLPPQEHQGTINLIVLVNQSMSHGALIRVAALLTEAKTAVLMDLEIPSRQSWELATGTGTDQFAIAAPLPARTGAEIRWPSSHTLMGQLVGSAVREAVAKALLWQNGLEPSLGRSVFHALGRFGLDREAFVARLRVPGFDRALGAFIEANLDALAFDPATCAAAWAMATIEEKRRLGILPGHAAIEALLVQGGILRSGLSAGAVPPGTLVMPGAVSDATLVADIAFTALIEGWRAKWN